MISIISISSPEIEEPIIPSTRKATSPLRLKVTVSPEPEADEVDVFELARRKYGLDLSDDDSDA